MTAKHIISCSDGMSLHFPTKEEYTAYKQKELLLKVQTYVELRDKYGIYDAQADKYVPVTETVLDWEGRPPVMEQLYQAYKESGMI